MGTEALKEAVEDEDQTMDFVTLGMFIIGMFTLFCLLSSYAPIFYMYHPHEFLLLMNRRRPCCLPTTNPYIISSTSHHSRLIPINLSVKLNAKRSQTKSNTLHPALRSVT